MGARLQHKSERKRLVIEEKRLEGELQAQELDRAGEVINARRDLYLAYLTTFDAAWQLCHDSEQLTTVHVNEWWSTYQAVQQRMSLLAAGPVAAAIDNCRDLFSAFAGDLEIARLNNSDAQEAARGAVWTKHAEEMRSKQTEIEQRMREDLKTPE